MSDEALPAAIRRAMFVHAEVKERIGLQFAESERLDRRLGASLRFSGTMAALLGGAILVAVNVGELSASAEETLRVAVIAVATLTVANVATAAIAYTRLSSPWAGVEIGDLIDQDDALDDEEDVIWWAILTNEAAVQENTELLRGKGALVAFSFVLAVATTAMVAVGLWAGSFVIGPCFQGG